MSRPKKLADPNGRHIRVYFTVLHSQAWRALSANAKRLYLDMRADLTGSNNGDLSATLSNYRHKGWRSSATLSKALYELRALGFIAITRAGGISMGGRVCTLYRFTDLDVFYQPKVQVEAVKATHDYRHFKSLREAESARDEGVAKLRDEGRRKQRNGK